MLAQAFPTNSAAAHSREDERLYDQIEGLAALAAFPAARLPLDLAVSIAAAAQTAQARIGELLPRYCGFGLGEVVDVAGVAPALAVARVDSVFINEGGTASILLRPIGADGSEQGEPQQFPLFYARCAMTPSECAPADPEESPLAPC